MGRSLAGGNPTEVGLIPAFNSFRRNFSVRGSENNGESLPRRVFLSAKCAGVKVIRPATNLVNTEFGGRMTMVERNQ